MEDQVKFDEEIYLNKIKELQGSRDALRIKINKERKIYRELMGKYLKLSQEFMELKKWDQHLMEFMGISPEDKEIYIKSLKL